MRKFIYFILTTALAASFIGCGESDGDEPSGGSDSETAEALTKAEFIRQADAICEKADRAQTTAFAAYKRENPKAGSSKAEVSKMISVAGIPPILTEVEELAELRPPRGEEKKIKVLVEGIEKAARKGAEDPASLKTSPDNPFIKVGEQAAKYGFKACDKAL